MEKISFKSKKVLFAGWGVENSNDTYMYQIYYLMLKKIFPLIETFDTKKIFFQSGKDSMNNQFLELLQKKDNYDLILFVLFYDEFYPETLEKIRELCPKSKTGIIICDDDAKFDNESRYFSLFFDYVITSQDYVGGYTKEGIKAFFHLDYNTYKLKPMNLKKIYDVTFIGRPKADRNEVIKYLLDNGIKVTLFGWDWHKYSEFKGIYQGSLNSEEYAKAINQSKINLSPAKAGYSEEKNHYNIKGRYFEVALCKSFQLIERFPTLLKFFNEKEIGMYDSQEDMLKKIKYYLRNEKERERMAERAYEKTIKKYNREKQLINIFTSIFKDKSVKNLPETNKKIITLEKKDLYLDLTEKLKNIDYVSFKNKNLKTISAFKNYFLSRALDVTKKNISCCDYYLSSFGLKNYAIFVSGFAFRKIGKETSKLIDINQIMVKKSFFLDNLPEFRELYKGKTVNLFSDENTAFISMPLVSIKKNKSIEYEKMQKIMEMRFQNDLFSLFYQKKLLTNKYPYLLLLNILTGKFFILKYLFKSIKDQNNKDKLSLNQSYIENSPLEKFKK
jgi:hypothetical protein